MVLLIVLLSIGVIIYGLAVRRKRNRVSKETLLLKPNEPVVPRLHSGNGALTSQSSPDRATTAPLAYAPRPLPITPPQLAPQQPLVERTTTRSVPPSITPTLDSWIPAGQPVTIAGYTIPGGLLYVGAQWRNACDHPYSTEPALINPALPVNSAHPDRTGVSMDYWPSYDRITPEARSAYLEWLADGKHDPHISIGYVFLFFYGLERRLLVDAKHSPIARTEAPLILAEVERLLKIYGNNRSFHGYATGFLDAARLSLNLLQGVSVQPPPYPRRDNFTLDLKLGLLHVVSKQHPIPPSWALAWLECHPSTRLGTPAHRCREEFEQLFTVRYRERFNAGLLVKPNKTKLKLTYTPASLSLPRPITVDVGNLPDITALEGPVNKFREVAETCIEELSPYSRAVGRLVAGEQFGLPILALLPAALLNSSPHPLWSALADRLENAIGQAGHCIVPAAGLLQLWSPSLSEKLSKSEAVSFINCLAKCGFGLEPDVRFGSPVLTTASRLVLFRLNDADPAAPSANYAAAALLLQLAVMVAAADGSISEAEEQHLRQYLESALALSPAEIRRLNAYLQWLLATPPRPSSLKRRLDLLNPEQRQTIAQFLVTIAAADGHIDSSEIRTLSKLYPLLGLNPDQLYTHLHGVVVQAAVTEPVTVRPASTQPTGYAIPPTVALNQSALPDGRLALDMAVIERKLRETREVQAVLASIFSGEEEETLTLSGRAPAPAATVTGLDAEHSTLLKRITQQSQWAREQFDALCAHLGLLPDGAMESLNEAAFERVGEPLLEGDDPVDVNAAVAQEMLL